MFLLGLMMSSLACTLYETNIRSQFTERVKYSYSCTGLEVVPSTVCPTFGGTQHNLLGTQESRPKFYLCTSIQKLGFGQRD
jgi:hypothetical protein